MHWVDQICGEYNLSINQLAKLAGVSTGVFSNAKRRNTQLSKCSYSLIRKLSHVLNVFPETLILKYDD